ncbi:type IV pilus modification PilV family protein [Vibrio mexicanus]|uniref:type IV pilus modification PilV family protein n=1 Tax=Vibrio mexicanus TaxID=1004326 RepID=UPI00063CC82A|nr:type II secretion system protein [Vibrio mexicanus]
MRRTRGFTLIESVIVIIVMGIAMITMSSLLSPQLARSGDPHYQTRAAALGQSLMTQILARSFDEESDQNGGAIRCSSSDLGQEPCSEATGSTRVLGSDGEDPEDYDDVDDYIGCWEPEGINGCGDLNRLLSGTDTPGATTYKNFRVEIDVVYNNIDYPDWSMKRVDMTIQASNQPELNFSGYRGNY